MDKTIEINEMTLAAKNFLFIKKTMTSNINISKVVG
jgi:hypothetical protein